ncbi:MAG: hypothetical protein ABSB35_30130 [Bryobacteraceae bacterium]|jgi:hypothetical protein
MSQLGTFFRGDDTRLGVFYPQHSLLAIFPDIERASRAKQQLRAAGFSDDEVLATSGSDLIKLDEEESSKNGLHGYLMRELSRFLDTEAVYTDNDLRYAKRGAAVLAVHCPDERTKRSAWRIIAAADPLAARYYSLSGIEHLAGET